MYSLEVAQFLVGNSPTFRFLTLALLSISLFNLGASAGSSSDSNNPSLISRFWEIGCEFSGVVSRVRRSAPNPPPEEPNFDDPEELFKYLYPLADVKPEDNPDHVGSQRSNYGTHSLSSWLEDLMELWHSECLHRRRKRSAERREDYNKKASEGESWSSQAHRIRGRVDRKPSSIARKNSSLEMSLSRTMGDRRGDNYDGGEINGDQNYSQYYGHDYNQSANGDLGSYYGGTLDQPTSSNNGYYGGDENYSWRNEELLEELFDKEEDKLEDKFKPKPQPTTAAPTTAAPLPPVPVPSPPEDIFFAQYGGDIEYFFPLLSFGIPFDGEITLLGFHGFHGIFPY